MPPTGRSCGRKPRGAGRKLRAARFDLHQRPDLTHPSLNYSNEFCVRSKTPPATHPPLQGLRDPLSPLLVVQE